MAVGMALSGQEVDSILDDLDEKSSAAAQESDGVKFFSPWSALNRMTSSDVDSILDESDALQKLRLECRKQHVEYILNTVVFNIVTKLKISKDSIILLFDTKDIAEFIDSKKLRKPIEKLKFLKIYKSIYGSNDTNRRRSSVKKPNLVISVMDSRLELLLDSIDHKIKTIILGNAAQIKENLSAIESYADASSQPTQHYSDFNTDLSAVIKTIHKFQKNRLLQQSQLFTNAADIIKPIYRRYLDTLNNPTLDLYTRKDRIETVANELESLFDTNKQWLTEKPIKPFIDLSLVSNTDNLTNVLEAANVFMPAPIIDISYTDISKTKFKVNWRVNEDELLSAFVGDVFVNAPSIADRYELQYGVNPLGGETVLDMDSIEWITIDPSKVDGATVSDDNLSGSVVIRPDATAHPPFTAYVVRLRYIINDTLHSGFSNVSFTKTMNIKRFHWFFQRRHEMELERGNTVPSPTEQEKTAAAAEPDNTVPQPGAGKQPKQRQNLKILAGLGVVVEENKSEEKHDPRFDLTFVESLPNNAVYGSSQASNKREIITFHLGGCGVRMGTTFWRRVGVEHCLDLNGGASQAYVGHNKNAILGNMFSRNVSSPLEASDGGSSGSSSSSDNGVTYTPRCISVDFNDTTLNRVINSDMGGFFRPQSFVHINDEPLWVNGLECESKYSNLIDIYRKEAERSDHLCAVQLIHGLSGHTGGGFAAGISDYLNNHFSKIEKVSYFVVKDHRIDLGTGPTVVNMNQVLTFAQLNQVNSLNFQLDNSTIIGSSYRNASQANFANIPLYQPANEFAAAALANITSTFRYDNAAINRNYTELIANVKSSNADLPKLNLASIAHSGYPCIDPHMPVYEYGFNTRLQSLNKNWLSFRENYSDGFFTKGVLICRGPPSLQSSAAAALPKFYKGLGERGPLREGFQACYMDSGGNNISDGSEGVNVLNASMDARCSATMFGIAKDAIESLQRISYPLARQIKRRSLKLPLFRQYGGGEVVTEQSVRDADKQVRDTITQFQDMADAMTARD